MKKYYILVSLLSGMSINTACIATDSELMSILNTQWDVQSDVRPEASSQVDFFSLAKGYQTNPKQDQQAYDLQQSQNYSNTSNMSNHDKAQYYLQHNDANGLNIETKRQQLSSLERSKKTGVISKEQYQQQYRKHMQPSAQTEYLNNTQQKAEFSIPLND